MSAASMALRRCLLRRITPGPGVPLPRTTVQAAPASSISRRFMGTTSLQGATMTDAELEEFIKTGTDAELEEFINETSKKTQEKLDEFDRLHEKLAVDFKAMDVVLKEKRKAVENLEKLTNAGFGVIFAIPVLVILASNYKA